MGKAIKWTGKVLSAGIIAILVLSAFCLVYSYSGTHIDNTSSATDYKWLPNELRTTMSEGFSWLRMDTNGFNNHWNPISESINVLLMGSSHEEAVNVGATQSTAYVLNSLLQTSDSYCFSIAMSGHTICHNVKNLAAAVEEYKPTDCVVIETSTINPLEAEMASVVDGTFQKIPSYDSGIFFYLQKVPALKSIYKSLESLVLSGSVSEAEDTLSLQEIESPTYEATLKNFLEKAKTDAGDIELKIIYHPRFKINTDATVTPITEAEKVATFSKLCSEVGIELIDMTGPFTAHYNESHELPHGFSNTSEGSGHLNSIGHKLMAEAIYRTLIVREVSE